MSNVVLFIAESRDHFIAEEDGGVGWLPSPDDVKDQNDCGYAEFLKRIDSIIMGSNSYEITKTFGPWAWTDKSAYVFTKRSLDSIHPSIALESRPPEDVITELKANNQNDIWLFGGGEFVAYCDSSNFIDELIITSFPVNLGSGIPLTLNYNKYSLISREEFAGGITQVFYKKIPKSGGERRI